MVTIGGLTGIKGIIKVLRARGYECNVVDSIPSFGFVEG